MGLLTFENNDEDRMDRALQPIYYRKEGTLINNKLNAYMDHIWDGFYTGQIRVPRFHGIVWSPAKSVYEVAYTGTPGKKMTYLLNSQDPTASMMIRIAYPGAESR